jgi:glutathione-independent formaldehyde dehydrogenase
MQFNICCAFCRNCEAGLTAYCLSCFPGMAGAAYGFAGMGPFNGEQAEYLRVPYGDFNCLRLPPEAKDPEKQLDYVMLSDIYQPAGMPPNWPAWRPATLSLFMAPDRLD